MYKNTYKHSEPVPVVYWLLSQEMDTAIRVQILDETDCISHSTNTLGKSMNPIILPGIAPILTMKNNKSKRNSTSVPDDKFGCHVWQGLP